MGDDLRLIKETHTYINADQKVIPSVSEIIACLSNLVYGDVDKYLLEKAAERGTAIHEMFQVLYKEKIVDCPYEYSGYLEASAKFIKDVELLEYFAEESFESKEGFAGTIDIYGQGNGKLTLYDLKTSSRVSNKNLVVYEAQLNLYRRLLEEHCYSVEQMFIVHLKKDGTYKLYEIPKSDNLADACLLIYKRMNEKKRRSK